MKINIIFSYYNVFYEWAMVTCYNLRKLGIDSDFFCPSVSISQKPKSFLYPDADYYIILNNSQFKLQEIPQCAKRIIWLTEPIDFDSKNVNIKNKSEYLVNFYDHADFFIAYTQSVKHEAESNGFKIDDVFCYGYDDILAKYANKYKKNIDIYFEGTDTDRRKKIIESINTNNINIIQKGYFHDDYFKTMAQSKIALNIHAYDDCKVSFEMPRIMSAILNKALVISENIINPSPLNNGEHIVLGEKEQLADLCKYYLNNEEERQKITNKVFDFVKTNCRMEDYLYNFIVNNIDKNFEKKINKVDIPKIGIIN